MKSALAVFCALICLGLGAGIGLVGGSAETERTVVGGATVRCMAEDDFSWAPLLCGNHHGTFGWGFGTDGRGFAGNRG